ncbi:MAG TPA: biopolymer transporter ExbD [Candidatus Methylomirabilis sp.]|nr:biopolymer transporter ExbD [Candidatus Methylomirabilis sp.]
MAGNIGGSGEGDDEMISGINVTPLVDITLVLLIIFMVTTSYIVREAIEVSLPRTSNAGQSHPDSTLSITLTREGAIYVDGVQRSEEDLKALAHKAAAQDSEARTLISADRQALHGAVVHVIDLVKGEGISRFAINIERGP